MSAAIESPFPLLKLNAVLIFPTTPYYTSIVPVKKAKLDDVKSLSKYLSQPTINYINNIPKQLGGADDDEEELISDFLITLSRLPPRLSELSISTL